MFSSGEDDMGRSPKRVLCLISATVSELQSGEAILRRIVLVAVALGLPLAFYSATYPLSSFATIGLTVGVSSLLTALSWLKEDRLKGLFLLPFSRRSVKAAVCAVGVSSAAVSDAIPITLAFYLVGSISTASALATFAVGVFAAIFSFVLISSISPLGAAIKMNAKALLSKKTKGKEPSSEEKGRHEGGRSPLYRFSQKWLSSNYFLTSIYRNANTWFSLLGLTAIGVVATDAMLNRGVLLPIHSICIALTPTLSTLLSRDRDTRRQMIVLENDRTIMAQYAAALMIAVLPLVLAGDVVLLVFWQTMSIGFVVASIVVYLVAVLVIIILEMRFPLLKWKTENEMYRHPRRYLPLIAALLVAGIIYLI